MTRAFNAISPISLNLKSGPGRRLLFNSGYDLRISTYYAPDGTNLTDHPEIRSRFQQAIGNLNLEKELEVLARDPQILASITQMQADIRAGRRGDFNARDYYHNIVIDRIFKKYRSIAWDTIKNENNIYALRQSQERVKAEQSYKTLETYNLQNMYK